MRANPLFMFILMALLVCGCKKTSSPAAPVPNNSASNLLSGIFFNFREVMNFVPNGTVNTIGVKVSATFFEPAVTSSQVYGTAYADVGNVFVNSKKLNKTLNPASYEAVLAGDYPLTYSVTGNGNFPATVFTDNGSLAPGFSNYDQFPDTISKSAGITFTLNNLVNTSGVEVLVNNKSFVFTNNVISISAADLSSVSTSTFGNLQIKCMQSAAPLLNGGGKMFQYHGVFIYQKQGCVVTQ